MQGVVGSVPKIVPTESGAVTVIGDLLLAVYARCATAAEVDDFLSQHVYRADESTALVREVAEVMLDEVVFVAVTAPTTQLLGAVHHSGHPPPLRPWS